MKNLQKVTRHPVLYQDDFLLIIDKPSGVLSHPNPPRGKEDRPKPCAFEGPYDFEKRCFETPEGPLWLIHRLDQEASGVLLAAWNEETAAKCRTLFEQNKIQKTYLVLVSGKPFPAAGQWRDYIGVQKKQKHVRAHIAKGKKPNAELRYSTERFSAHTHLTLLKISLVTGKTHQIRIQTASHGCPVAGDEVYGNFQLNRRLRKDLGLRRLFLHASKLAFRHPETHGPLVISSALPDKLEDCLQRL